MRQFGLFDKLFKKKDENEEKTEDKVKEEKPLDQKDVENVEIEQEPAGGETESSQLHNQELDEQDFTQEVEERAQNIEALADKEVTDNEYQNNLEEESIAKILKKTPKLIGKIQSQIDKYDDVEFKKGGRVVHKSIRMGKPKSKGDVKEYGRFREFPNIDGFKRWRTALLKHRKENLKERLSPLAFYVTQGIGHERPFTGDHWWTKDVGMYSCVVCTQRLFMSDHKYESKTGYPTFWSHIIDAVEFKRDTLTRPNYGNAFEDPTLKNKTPVQRCLCSNCESHLGFIYDDGPGPFYKRFMINSVALDFAPKPWFKIKDLPREALMNLKKERETSMSSRKAFLNLMHDEKFMGLPSLENRIKRDKCRVTVAKKKVKLLEVERQRKRSRRRVFNIKGESRIQSNQKKASPKE